MTSTTQYANLTLNDLCELHTQISEDAHALHLRIMKTRIFTDEGDALRAEYRTMTDVAEGVYAEIQRRELNLAPDPFEPVAPHSHEIDGETATKFLCPVGGCWWNA